MNRDIDAVIEAATRGGESEVLPETPHMEGSQENYADIGAFSSSSVSQTVTNVSEWMRNSPVDLTSVCYDLTAPGLESEDERESICLGEHAGEGYHSYVVELICLQNEINSQEWILLQIEILLALGARTVKEVAENSRHLKNTLVEYVATMEVDEDIIRKRLKSKFTFQQQQEILSSSMNRLLEITKETIRELVENAADTEMLLLKLDELQIDVISFNNLKKLRLEIIRRKKEKISLFQSKINLLQTTNQCCILFSKYPAPKIAELIETKLPTSHYPSEDIMQTLLQTIKRGQDHSSHSESRLSCPTILRFRLHQLFHDFRSGVAKERFWKRYSDIFGCSPSYNSISLSDLHEATQGEIFYSSSDLKNIRDDFPFILFPICQIEYSISPSSVLRTLYHRLKALIAHHPYLSIDDDLVTDLIDQIVIDWNMSRIDVLYCCIETMKEQGEEMMTLQEVNVVNERDVEMGHCKNRTFSYICIDAAAVIKSIYGKHELIKEEPNVMTSSSRPKRATSETLAIVDESVDEYEAMVEIPSGIKEGHQFPCKVVSIYGPNRFGLIFTDASHQEKIKEFRRNFMKWTATSKLRELNQSEICVGQYVLLHYNFKEDCEGKHDWHRARIISTPSPKCSDLYQVHVIDKGCVVSSSVFELRQMSGKVLSLAPALSAFCSLKHRWTPSVAASTMSEVVKNAQLMLTTGWKVSLKYRDLSGVGRWKSVRDAMKRKLSKEDWGEESNAEDSDDAMDALAYYLGDKDE